MIPPQLMARKPNISKHEIYLLNGATIVVAGLDNPARIEGAPIDGLLADEVDDIKRSAWEEHIDPMFIDRGAWAMYTGVPNGLAYLYEISKNSLKFPDEWDFFTWKSAEVMSPIEVKKFQDRMDSRSFAQEFEASFENFTGRVYYAFTRENYKHELWHNPSKPLIFCFDFNVSPGIAVVCQEQQLPGQFEEVLHNGVWLKQPVIGTGVIGEVWIPQNSNTLIVCQRLYNDWKHHKGEIICYGDAAGGNKTASAVSGSDWDLIKAFFKNTEFANRISYKYPRANPPIKKRINSMNSRFCSVTGVRRMMVDAVAAPKLIEDLEQLSLLEGGSGEIDEKKNKMIGHECFSGDTLVQTNRGIQRLDSISDSGKIKGYDGKMHNYINGGKPTGIKPTVKVLLSNGEEIICTPTHEFLTLSGWKKAIDIEGDFLYNELFHNNERQPFRKTSKLARLAVKNFQQINMLQTNIAPKNAALLDEKVLIQRNYISKLRALIAKFCLKRLRTNRKNSANGLASLQVISVVPHKTIQTFCPTVENGCFLLANGCLVSNSAALGYYVTEEFPVDSSNSVQTYDL